MDNKHNESGISWCALGDDTVSLRDIANCRGQLFKKHAAIRDWATFVKYHRHLNSCELQVFNTLEIRGRGVSMRRKIVDGGEEA